MHLVSIGRGTVSRELERLVNAGLLIMSRDGNRYYYQANPGCPIFRELVSILCKITEVNADQQASKTQLICDDSLVVSDQLSISRSTLRMFVDQHHIHRLPLFGSAARGELADDSDIDLIVEFETGKAPSLGGMVKLKDAFTGLFGGRSIDLATLSILNNPYRRSSIKRDMRELYASCRSRSCISLGYASGGQAS